MREPAKWIAGEDYCKQGKNEGKRLKVGAWLLCPKNREVKVTGGMRQKARRGVQMVRGAQHLRTGK